MRIIVPAVIFRIIKVDENIGFDLCIFSFWALLLRSKGPLGSTAALGRLVGGGGGGGGDGIVLSGRLRGGALQVGRVELGGGLGGGKEVLGAHLL